MMPFVVGENVGVYRLIEKLGRGGMATVYKAYHAKLERYVAIKALHPAFLEDPNFLARFQREARVVAKLEHPHIVPIYDFAEHEGRPYLVMKFVEGETLKACLKRGDMTPDQIVEVVEAVGHALTYAHQRGVLHRDVKPSNVLLADDGRIYLADFGLARIAEAGESTLSADMMLGTPQYISPEQAMGDSDLDDGTDIYSFGVMLYELTVGRVPFSGDTPFSVIHDHIYTPLPLPSVIKADMPEALERVLLKALAKEREDRYEQVDDLVAAFKDAYLEAQASLAGQATAVVAGSAVVTEETPDAVATSPPSQGDESQAATAEKPRRHWRWWYLAPITLGLILFCFLGVAGANLIQNQIEANRPAAAATEPVDIEADSPVEQARQKASQHPDDPFAQLDLAMVLFDAGEIEEANQAIETAYALGEGDADLYLKIASLFHQREMWFQASKAYIHVAKQFPEKLTEENLDAFHQSIYLAASQPEAAPLFPELAETAPAMERVAKARHVYYANGQDVQEIIDQAFESVPDLHEARLLQVEILADQGRRPAARLIAADLKRDNPPKWIQDQLAVLFPGGVQSGQMLDELLAQVEANPEDTNLRIHLIDALLEVEQWEQAEEQITFLLEKAEEDPNVYFHLGEIFENRDIWLYAARLYQAGVTVGGTAPSPEMISKIHGLVYLGAANPDAMPVLEEMEADLIPLIVEIARIRHTLHHQEREAAFEKITQVKEQYPDSPEVLLLEAEIFYILGEGEQAIQQWRDLVADQQAPPWVHDQAKTFLETFQP
jgi:tRNA A-37 threonylcarbamoyl transferase component Bud32/tetratricopeptide (TPR) repeat protein